MYEFLHAIVSISCHTKFDTYYIHASLELCYLPGGLIFFQLYVVTFFISNNAFSLKVFLVRYQYNDPRIPFLLVNIYLVSHVLWFSTFCTACFWLAYYKDHTVTWFFFLFLPNTIICFSLVSLVHLYLLNIH